MPAPTLPLTRVLLLYVPAVAAGALFQWLNVPLPWMLGPLMMVGALYATGVMSAAIPASTRLGGQVVVGLQIGVYFTAQAVGALAGLVPLLLSVAVLTLISAAVVALVGARLTGRPAAPAFLAILPFSPVEAAVLTERYAWSPGPIVLSQILRIGMAVTTVPVVMYLIDGWPSAPAGGTFAAEINPIRTLILLGLGLAAAGAFRVMGLTNPYFMGPLLVSAIAAVMGLDSNGFPFAVVAAAQLVLGVWLGSAFRRAVFMEARAQLRPIVVSSVTFLLMVVGGALMMAWAFDQPWRALVLGAIPGGVTEMALTAKFLGVDVTLVTGLQLTRILLIAVSMRALVEMVNRLDGRR